MKIPFSLKSVNTQRGETSMGAQSFSDENDSGLKPPHVQPRLQPPPLSMVRQSLDRRLIRIQRDVLKMGALVENSCLFTSSLTRQGALKHL